MLYIIQCIIWHNSSFYSQTKYIKTFFLNYHHGICFYFSTMVKFVDVYKIIFCWQFWKTFLSWERSRYVDQVLLLQVVEITKIIIILFILTYYTIHMIKKLKNIIYYENTKIIITIDQTFKYLVLFST